jgi:putative transposase
MECIRGHVYRLKPTPEQEVLLGQTVGVVRLVYNLALEQRRTFGGLPYGGGKPRYFGSKGLSAELSALRRDYDWIGAVSQTAQNQALVDLDKAYENFFKGRAGYPSPRKRGRNDGFRHVGREVAVRRLNSKWSEVKIPKMGWIRYRDTRPLRPGADGEIKICNATIRRVAGGGWEISIATRSEIAEQPVPAAAVGIDRGVAVPYALSTGEMVLLPDAMKKRRDVQRRVAKTLSRRKRGSRRYAKVRDRLARLRAKDARTRSHIAHVLSRQLVGDFGLIAIEDLRIRNMTTSAKGTMVEPGSRVAQKSGLNRAILNVGWYALERMLAYKLEETGGLLIKVPAAYTSQTCACCGHVDARSRESQAIFCCTACGAAANADTNAAKTILARAMRVQANDGRENIPFLDVEASALAAFEASTHVTLRELDALAG